MNLTRFKYVYGPVPSRRLGKSLGVSPIPEKTCNYACIYCQLGRTRHMTNQRMAFFPLEAILKEAQEVIGTGVDFDVVTIVGEGEPTLYRDLGDLIRGLKNLTNKPVAVITNGALLYDSEVQQALMAADLVLPSLDAVDATMFKQINRPHGALSYQQVAEGLKTFSHLFQGQLWLEIMLVKGLNDSELTLRAFRKLLHGIRYDRLYINTVVRPPAEETVEAVGDETLEMTVKILGGLPMATLVSGSFFSSLVDPMAALMSLIQRHPMNQFEIEAFLESRSETSTGDIFKKLQADERIEVVRYKGYETYRLK